MLTKVINITIFSGCCTKLFDRTAFLLIIIFIVIIIIFIIYIINFTSVTQSANKIFTGYIWECSPVFLSRCYISQLFRFARMSSHVSDFNSRNKILTAKLLHQAFSKFYRRYYELISIFKVRFKSLLQQGLIGTTILW